MDKKTVRIYLTAYGGAIIPDYVDVIERRSKRYSLENDGVETTFHSTSNDVGLSLFTKAPVEAR